MSEEFEWVFECEFFFFIFLVFWWKYLLVDVDKDEDDCFLEIEILFWVYDVFMDVLGLIKLFGEVVILLSVLCWEFE